MKYKGLAVAVAFALIISFSSPPQARAFVALVPAGVWAAWAITAGAIGTAVVVNNKTGSDNQVSEKKSPEKSQLAMNQFTGGGER